MIVRAATDDDVWHVIGHLRAPDAHEQFVARWNDDPMILAAELIAMRELAIAQMALACDDGEAAILVGAYLTSPGVARFHMCATDRFNEIARAGHRWGRQRFIPQALAPNVRVAEARILAGNRHTLRWLAACGFVQEGICRQRGKNGEDVVMVAWYNPGEPQ